MAKKKQSKLRKIIGVFNPSTRRGGLALFILTFAVIGGGYMMYRSFATTPTNIVVSYYKYIDSKNVIPVTYVKNSLGSSTTKIDKTSMYYPVWSSDKNKLLYSYDNLNIFDLSTKATTLLDQRDSKTNSQHSSYDWSFDNTKVIYSKRSTTSTGSKANIHLINSDGTGKVQLTSAGTGVYNGCPAWQPGGDLIAFVHSEPTTTGKTSLWTMKADGTSKKKLFEATTSSNTGPITHCPIWAPKGGRIAFNTLKGGDYLNAHLVHTVGADGTNHRLLGTGELDSWSFRTTNVWSPDAKHLLIRKKNSSGVENLYKLEIATKVIATQLTSGQGVKEYNHRGWLPDGRIVYYEQDKGYGYGKLYSMNPDKSDKKLLADPDSGLKVYDLEF